MTESVTEKVAVAGLARLAAWVWGSWGVGVLGKGVWDCRGGRPEARFFSVEPERWVTQEQWLRFAGFELIFGASCVALGAAAWAFSRRLPQGVERPRSSSL